MFSFVIAAILISLLLDKKVGIKMLASLVVIGLILAPSMTMREHFHKATERFLWCAIRSRVMKYGIWL